MPYTLFQTYFPDIAERETRCITMLDNSVLPVGSYGLLEMYCDDPGCDCRRVFLSVISSVTKQIEAVIAYGWESSQFYAKWFGDNDPDIIKELKGPILNLSSPQGKLAPAILKVVEELILQDQVYIERLKTHYKLFRGRVGKGPKVRLVKFRNKRKGKSTKKKSKKRR